MLFQTYDNALFHALNCIFDTVSDTMSGAGWAKIKNINNDL